MVDVPFTKSGSANDLHWRHKSLVLMFKNVTVVDITAELLLGIEIYDDEDRRMGLHWNGVVPQVTTRIGGHGTRFDFKRGRMWNAVWIDTVGSQVLIRSRPKLCLVNMEIMHLVGRIIQLPELTMAIGDTNAGVPRPSVGRIPIYGVIRL